MSRSRKKTPIPVSNGEEWALVSLDPTPVLMTDCDPTLLFMTRIGDKIGILS